MNAGDVAPLCLSTLFALGVLPADRDGDGLPDTLRGRLVVGLEARRPEHLAGVDIAARLGFESLALHLPLVATERAGLPADGISLFIRRPTTLPPACPTSLSAALAGLQPGEGLVAMATDVGPALLAGGADAAGLADAARLVAAYLPGLQSGSEPGGDLGELSSKLRAACGRPEMPLVVEALVTRRGRVAEARLRATVAATELDQVRSALAAMPGTDDLPYDLAVTLEAGTGGEPIVVRVAGGAREPAIYGPSPDVPSGDIVPMPRSLAGLYGPAGVAVDGDGDLLPEVPRARILLPDDLSPAEAAEAAHLGARLGLETLGLALPLAYPHGEAPPEPGHVAISVEPLYGPGGGTPGAGEGELQLLEAGDGACVLRVRGGDARGREMALYELARLDASGPADGEPSLEEVQQALQRLCALADPNAWACAALAAVPLLPDSAVETSPEPLSLHVLLPAVSPALRAAVEECIADVIQSRAPGLALGVEAAAAADGAPILDETHRLSWEVDDAWDRFNAEVLPALAALPPESRDWTLDVRLGEPEGRRRQIKNEMLRQIRAAGRAAGADQVQVLPAYRQGRAWLLEEVAPRLPGRDVAAITIRVQRFEPGYPCLELPIRWLQDMHPVDELLGERLGLPRDAVRFEPANLSCTYEVEAANTAGESVWRGSFDVIHGRRPYLHGVPDWGMVHPPTGCVRLLAGGVPVVDARVAPDPERVWDLVQAALLPRLREHILTVTNGAPHPNDQPFFGSLSVEAWLSEEDAALGLREERDSPLESLHEDLYFMLLDYCCALMTPADGAEPYRPPWVRPRAPHESHREARLWTAPGRIVPYIHRGDGGAGRVRLRLTAAPDNRPLLTWRRGEETGSVPLAAASGVTVRIAGLRLASVSFATERPARRLLLELDGPPEAREQARRILTGWAALRAAGALRDEAIPAGWAFSVSGDAGDDLQIAAAPPAARNNALRQDQETVGAVEACDCGRMANHADCGRNASGNPEESQASHLPGGETPAPWDRVLGLPDVEQSLRVLARSPHARAYQAGRSAGGHPSYAVEMTVPRVEGIWSRAKLSAWKCTLLLNARHHANEPSSTSALLRLADLLANDEGWRRYLDRVNVVLIPCENPDGAALHYALQEEHPTWMLHAGRYNDAGLEFVAEYANPNTRHTEALVLPALWRRWAPDIVCDDHGFPSHEWVQPFAGHSNPWFHAYWIAQGLIFVILPHIASPRYPRHAQATDSLRRRLIRALADDPEVRARNSIYADRYRTFLSAWLPDAFPARFEDDVLIEGDAYDPDDRARSRASLAGLPGAHPGVTTASLITEVADETAQGRYLALCAHAQLLADRVLLDYLFDANAPATVRRERRSWPGERTLLLAVRRRPALAGPVPSPDRPAVTMPAR